MQRNCWGIMPGLFVVWWLVAGNFTGDIEAGEDRGITLHHQAAGLTITLTTQPSPPRAGENLLRIDLTDVQGQAIPHAQVRLVITQAQTMPGMHAERPQEVEAASTHVGVYVGRVHLVSPGRWEVIVQVMPPGRPATRGLFYLKVEPA